MAKPNWTPAMRKAASRRMKDPAYQRRLQASKKRVHAVRKQQLGELTNGTTSTQDNHVSYAFGHTQAWLEAYAEGAGLSRSALTYRVAELLRRSAVRKGMGT